MCKSFRLLKLFFKGGDVMMISCFVFMFMCDVIARDRMCSVVCEVRETPGIREERHRGILGNSAMPCGIKI